MSAQDTKIEPEMYVPVAVDKLVVGTSLPFDGFIKDGSTVIPLFNKGTDYDQFVLNILREKGITTVQVRTSENADLENYLSRSVDQKRTMPDAETFNNYIAKKDEFYLIDRTLLVPGQKISFSLFLLNDFRINVLLPATEQLPTVIHEDVLRAKGDILIMPADIVRYNAYLDSLLAPGEMISPEQRKIKSIAMKENSKLILKDLLDHPRSGEKIKEAISTVNKMVDNIMNNRGAVFDLLSLRTFDYYTYTHSVNVAVLSVGLGMALGMAKEEIRRLGIGAILHDMGKSCIPATIINKADRLTDEEFRIIKTHVIEGEKILRVNKDIPEESFIAVSQHHERLTGRGYPNNIAGRQLKYFGRITAIVDCYDALTTTRSYQAARTPFLALSILTKESGDYDSDILTIFIKMLGTMKA